MPTSSLDNLAKQRELDAAKQETGAGVTEQDLQKKVQDMQRQLVEAQKQLAAAHQKVVELHQNHETAGKLTPVFDEFVKVQRQLHVPDVEIQKSWDAMAADFSKLHTEKQGWLHDRDSQLDAAIKERLTKDQRESVSVDNYSKAFLQNAKERNIPDVDAQKLLDAKLHEIASSKTIGPDAIERAAKGYKAVNMEIEKYKTEYRKYASDMGIIPDDAELQLNEKLKQFGENANTDVYKRAAENLVTADKDVWALVENMKSHSDVATHFKILQYEASKSGSLVDNIMHGKASPAAIEAGKAMASLEASYFSVNLAKGYTFDQIKGGWENEKKSYEGKSQGTLEAAARNNDRYSRDVTDAVGRYKTAYIAAATKEGRVGELEWLKEAAKEGTTAYQITHAGKALDNLAALKEQSKPENMQKFMHEKIHDENLLAQFQSQVHTPAEPAKVGGPIGMGSLDDGTSVVLVKDGKKSKLTDTDGVAIAKGTVVDVVVELNGHKETVKYQVIDDMGHAKISTAPNAASSGGADVVRGK